MRKYPKLKRIRLDSRDWTPRIYQIPKLYGQQKTLHLRSPRRRLFEFVLSKMITKKFLAIDKRALVI